MNRLRDSWARRGAGLPAAFWWLWGGMLVNSLANFVVVFLALFLRARGFGIEETGLVVSSFGIGVIAAGPLAGAFADRVGRRPTMLFALVASALLTALLGVLDSPASIVADVLAIGLVANAYRPASSAMVADLVAPADRARAFGLLYWAHNLGMAVSSSLGGLLAARSFTLLYLADAGTTLLFGAVIFRRVPETRPGPPPAPSGGVAPEPARGYRAVLGDLPFLSFLVLHTAFLVVFMQFLTTAPMDMARHGLGSQVFGPVIAVNGLIVALFQPVAARVVGRFDPGRVLALGAAVVGVGYFGYGLATTAIGYGLATAVWTLGEVMIFPTAVTVVAGLSPPDLRGRYQGLYGLTAGVAMFLSPALGTRVLARLGPGVLWPGCLVLALLVALGHFAIGPARRRRLGTHSPR